MGACVYSLCYLNFQRATDKPEKNALKILEEERPRKKDKKNVKKTIRKIFVESDSDEGCSDDPMSDTSSELKLN